MTSDKLHQIHVALNNGVELKPATIANFWKTAKNMLSRSQCDDTNDFETQRRLIVTGNHLKEMISANTKNIAKGASENRCLLPRYALSLSRYGWAPLFHWRRPDVASQSWHSDPICAPCVFSVPAQVVELFLQCISPRTFPRRKRKWSRIKSVCPSRMSLALMTPMRRSSSCGSSVSGGCMRSGERSGPPPVRMSDIEVMKVIVSRCPMTVDSDLPRLADWRLLVAADPSLNLIENSKSL